MSRSMKRTKQKLKDRPEKTKRHTKQQKQVDKQGQVSTKDSETRESRI